MEIYTMTVQILNKTNAHDFSPLPLQLRKTQHMKFILVHRLWSMSEGLQRAHTASLGGTEIPTECPEQLIMYTQN